ncbi:MAG TPA: glycosyltransferase, partial [Deltaproteobacteria bacterium]|nr:glycosyltransferase [Deltaproteobacteria bacterium]
MARDKISVVIPVYNEEPVIGRLMERLLPVMEGMDREYEIILVDDGSTDRSLEIMKGYAGGEVLVVELTRNYGQHAA